MASNEHVPEEAVYVPVLVLWYVLVPVRRIEFQTVVGANAFWFELLAS